MHVCVTDRGAERSACMWDRQESYGGSEGTFTPTPLLGGESSAFGGDGHTVGGDGGAVGGESANLSNVVNSGARTRHLSRPPRTLVKVTLVPPFPLYKRNIEKYTFLKQVISDRKCCFSRFIFLSLDTY